MQLSHHYIQNKNLTFNSWLKNLKKKKIIRGTNFEQGIWNH